MKYFQQATLPNSKTRVCNLSFNGAIDTVTQNEMLSKNETGLCYNVEGKSGALVHSFGIEQLKVNGKNVVFSQKVQKLWQYFKNTNHLLIAFCADHNLYSLDMSASEPTPTLIENSSFISEPMGCNYKLNDVDVMLFSSAQDTLKVYDGETLINVEQSPNLCSMCIHYERLFGCSNDNVLWFSDDLDPTNWTLSSTEAGFIEMADDNGKLQKVVSFADYVYVFREFGIARVSAYSVQQDFSVSQLFVTSGKIYPESVTVCGNKILFMSQDGIFVFDGSDTRKILSNLDGLFNNVDNSLSRGCYSNGKYVLSCKMNFNDNEKLNCEKTTFTNNALLIVDLNNFKPTILRGMDVLSMQKLVDDEQFIAFCLNESNNTLGMFSQKCNYFNNTLKKFWQTPLMDMSQSLCDKHFRYVALKTKHDIELKITVDEKDYYVHVKGKPMAQKIPIAKKGKSIAVSFASDFEQMNVQSPKIVYTVYSEDV